MLLNTFSGEAKTLKESFYNPRHEIYDCKTLVQAMTKTQRVFCSDIQAQHLKNLYQDKLLKANDVHFIVFLHQKMDLYLGYKSLHEIPETLHRPPNDYNPIFWDF